MINCETLVNKKIFENTINLSNSILIKNILKLKDYKIVYDTPIFSEIINMTSVSNILYDILKFRIDYYIYTKNNNELYEFIKLLYDKQINDSKYSQYFLSISSNREFNEFIKIFDKIGNKFNKSYMNDKKDLEDVIKLKNSKYLDLGISLIDYFIVNSRITNYSYWCYNCKNESIIYKLLKDNYTSKKLYDFCIESIKNFNANYTISYDIKNSLKELILFNEYELIEDKYIEEAFKIIYTKLVKNRNINNINEIKYHFNAKSDKYAFDCFVKFVTFVQTQDYYDKVKDGKRFNKFILNQLV